MAVVTFSHRHLVILALASTVACGGHPGLPSPVSPDQTVEQFLVAANANDLEAMALLWGDEHGPSSVTNTIPIPERIQRLTIMQRLLHSDNHLITATNASDPSKRVITVALTQGTRRFAVPFTVVPTRAGGWLIREIGLEAAMPQPGSRN
jgi:hypothetical protein